MSYQFSLEQYINMLLTEFLLSSFFILLGYILLSQRKRLKYWQNLGIECEEPKFILGNLTGLRTKRSFADVWQQYYNKFKASGKPFVGFYWFHSPAAFILDTALIKKILIQDFNKFSDRGLYNNIHDDPLSGQLFLLDGHKWRTMRHKLTPTFTSGKMKLMFPLVLNITDKLVQTFSDMMKKSTTVEIRDLLARFTTDVIGTCAFGIECSSLRDPKAEFRVMGKKAINESRHGNLGMAFMTSFPNLARKLHIKFNADDVEEFFLRIVRETVEYRELHHIRRNDFMDMLIDLKNNKLTMSEDGQDLKNLTLEEVAAQAFLFFNAGFETSSTTMGFALYEMAKHEDIQQRVRKEIEEVFAQNNNNLTYDCLKQLQYLGQVILETLRLYTVLPVLNRFCLEDYQVADDKNYTIKKGMQVIIPTNAIHRDADYYPDPNDFNPDNFLPEVVQSRQSCQFLGFGDGPRNCIGMRFAKMQARMGLAQLLKHFKFSICEKTQIPIEYDMKSYLVNPKNGIYLKVEAI